MAVGARDAYKGARRARADGPGLAEAPRCSVGKALPLAAGQIPGSILGKSTYQSRTGYYGPPLQATTGHHYRLLPRATAYGLPLQATTTGYHGPLAYGLRAFRLTGPWARKSQQGEVPPAPCPCVESSRLPITPSADGSCARNAAFPPGSPWRGSSFSTPL